MKQQWTKRILAGVATLALALPIAFGLGQQHTTHADDDTPAATQPVVLTKYGFTNEQTESDRDTAQSPDQAIADWATNAEPLAGVKFEVYDVTETYWKAPNDYSSTKAPSIDGLTAIKTGTTDDQGQIKASLPIQSGAHNAIYVFHETQPRTGYKAVSADFMLSLPATANADGNVYVYPKNVQHETYLRKFHKIDGVTNKDLPGAEFKITNVAGEYLQLIDVDGNVQATEKGYVDTEKANLRFNWVKADSEATTFTSDDKDGMFGLNGFDDTTTKYQAIETKAPAGYEKAADTTFTADGTTSDIKDMPRGILPHTGGAGILAILAVGSALIAFALVGIRKRQARA